MDFYQDTIQWRNGKKMAIGLGSICRRFGVSKSTAHRWKNGILKEAVIQQGKILFVDIDRAYEIIEKAKGSKNVQ